MTPEVEVASAAADEPASDLAGAGRVKVSVVVPVYNPGAYLEGCIESILGQSLPPDEFEAIFVDDGSTDESPARLDALAASHPNVRVIHQPNSGWPGKPRNVGIDAARGEYIYFVDHDDVLGPEALERLYAFAVRNDSDIVIGKMAGHGRGAPRQLFLESRDRVTIHDSGIIGALSPHKLFRRQFLDDRGIRFPEGRRRLEDQVFVVEAYFAADVISILADYTCYYHLGLGDHSNAASGRYDPAGRFDAAYYYGFLREVLRIVEANTEPGPQRDRLLRRFATREILGRLAGRRFLMNDPDRRRELLTEIQSVVADHIPPTIDTVLTPMLRTQLALVRADRMDLLLELAKAEHEVAIAARFRGLKRVDGGRLRLQAEAELVDGKGPLVFERRGEAVLLPVPPGVAAAVPEAAREVSPGGDLQVVLRRRRDSAEIVLRAPLTRRLPERGRGVRIVQATEVMIDPASPAEGFALRSGRWDVLLRMHLTGYTREDHLRRPAGLGRSRPVAIQDGRVARTPASWAGGPRRLVPGVVVRMGGSRPGRFLGRRLRRWMRRLPGRVGA